MLLQTNTFFTLRMMTMQHFYTGKNFGFSFCSGLWWSSSTSTSCWCTILTLVVEQKFMACIVDFFWHQAACGSNCQSSKLKNVFLDWHCFLDFVSENILTPFTILLKFTKGTCTDFCTYTLFVYFTIWLKKLVFLVI